MTDRYFVWVSVGAVYKHGKFGAAMWVEKGSNKAALADSIESSQDAFEMTWKTVRWAFSKLADKREDIVLALRSQEFLDFWNAAKSASDPSAGELGEFAKQIKAHPNWFFRLGEESADYDQYLRTRCYVMDVALGLNT